MYLTRKINLGQSDQLDQLTRRSGKLWSGIVASFWRTVRKQGVWLSKKNIQRWKTTGFDGLHSSSAQAVADQFYEALASWRENDHAQNPPSSQKRFNKVQWKSKSIKLRDDGVLRLSNGRGEDPLLIDWPTTREPKRVEIGHDGEQYELRCQYEVEPMAEPKGDKVAGIDLGEKHLAAAYDGDDTILLNGGALRALRHYRNKTEAKLQKRIDRKESGSNRWKKLVRTKCRQLRKLDNQITDLLHKLSTWLVATLHERGVGTVALGDVSGIREQIDGGTRMNQRLHQWAYGRFAHMIDYKARRRGMTVERVDEAYTSQTCPDCGHRHNPSGRDYDCPQCSFAAHRDQTGAVNIRRKYLGPEETSPTDRVLGAMASPSAVRFKAHMSCSSPPEDVRPSGRSC